MDYGTVRQVIRTQVQDEQLATVLLEILNELQPLAFLMTAEPPDEDPLEARLIAVEAALLQLDQQMTEMARRLWLMDGDSPMETPPSLPDTTQQEAGPSGESTSSVMSFLVKGAIYGEQITATVTFPAPNSPLILGDVHRFLLNGAWTQVMRATSAQPLPSGPQSLTPAAQQDGPSAGTPAASEDLCPYCGETRADHENRWAVHQARQEYDEARGLGVGPEGRFAEEEQG